MWSRTAAVVVLLVSTTAHADLTAVELQSRGEALAKAGRYGEAIDAFKAADKLERRASHACLISLAYARRDLFTQAELWNTVCVARARPDDPLPEWHATMEAQIADKLAALAPITVSVAPATAQLTLADFPDVAFGATTIHLAPGTHTIEARAPGLAPAERVIVVRDATPQHLAFELVPEAGPGPGPAPVLRPASRRLLVAGGVVAGAGLVTYAVMGVAFLRLHDQKGFGGTTETVYDLARPATIGLWAIGGALLVTGAVLHRSERAPTVAAAPITGGAMVSLRWQR